MKYSITKKVEIGDVSMDKTLRPDALTDFFQDVTISHAFSLGYTQDYMESINRHWVFSKIAFEMYEPVFFNDTIQVNTWSTGINKFKGFREYEVVKNGQVVCRGNSVWIYLDTARKRPAKPEPEISENFDSGETAQMELDLDKWNPGKLSDRIMTRDVSVRYTDFDINCHVNNTHYVDYLQTALYGLVDDFKGIRFLKMKYSAEISPAVRKVFVTLSKNGEEYVFHIYDGKNVYVSGEAVLF